MRASPEAEARGTSSGIVSGETESAVEATVAFVAYYVFLKKKADCQTKRSFPLNEN